MQIEITANRRAPRGGMETQKSSGVVDKTTVLNQCGLSQKVTEHHSLIGESKESMDLIGRKGGL